MVDAACWATHDFFGKWLGGAIRNARSGAFRYLYLGTAVPVPDGSEILMQTP